MKILLIRPPIYSRNLRFPAGPRFGAPLGLLSVAASARQAGHEVVFFDALAGFDPAKTVRDASGGYHIGASREEIAQETLRCRPAVVGITNPFADFADMALATARAVRGALPQTVIVAGGPHATADPGFFLAPQGIVNYVVRGEGEFTFVKLCDTVQSALPVSAIPGIAFMENGAMRINPAAPFAENLDSLPPPAWDLAPMERYFSLVRTGYPSRYTFEYPGSDREVSLVTSRGCPFTCVFCGNHLHMGRRWRSHSVQYVLGQIDLLVRQYDVRHIHFEDDNLSLDLQRFDALLDGIIANKWEITWDTPNGIRCDRLTPALLDKCKAAGCTYLIIGIESGNQRVLNEVIKKRLDLKHVTATAEACKKTGLDLHGFYVVGFPGETRAEITQTLDYALDLLRRYNVMPHVGLARPLPGTELFDISTESGFLTQEMHLDSAVAAGNEIFSRRMISTPEFNPADLQALVSMFHKKVMMTVVFSVLGWLVRHPVVMLRVAVQLVRWIPAGFGPAVKRVFFGGLFFRNNYLKNFKRIGQTG